MKSHNKKEQLHTILLILLFIIFGIASLVSLKLISDRAQKDEVYVNVALEARACAANYNLDGVINNLDLVLFIQNYRETGINCRYDLTGNCFVDTQDYSLFAKQFGDFCLQ